VLQRTLQPKVKALRGHNHSQGNYIGLKHSGSTKIIDQNCRWQLRIAVDFKPENRTESEKIKNGVAYKESTTFKRIMLYKAIPEDCLIEQAFFETILDQVDPKQT